MSIYDNRNGPAYRNHDAGPEFASNQFISKWWTSEHDDLIVANIQQWHWLWYWFIKDDILRVTSSATIEEWTQQDSACSRNSWYNLIMYFALSRAEQLGFVDAIRSSIRKTCPLCGYDFDENSLPVPFVKRLGINQLDFCAPCLSSAILRKGKDNATDGEIITYLQRLAEIIGIVPSQNYGEGMSDFNNLDIHQRTMLFKLFLSKPSISSIKSVFGSWLNALIQADILESSARKTSRGIQTIATDGHLCLSLGEKTICEFLYSRGIKHEKEPLYPEGKYRADFKVGTTFVEYFGLTGDAEYDAKTKVKMQICKKHNVPLIAIYAKDLLNEGTLQKKLSVLEKEYDAYHRI